MADQTDSLKLLFIFFCREIRYQMYLVFFLKICDSDPSKCTSRQRNRHYKCYFLYCHIVYLLSFIFHLSLLAPGKLVYSPYRFPQSLMRTNFHYSYISFQIAQVSALRALQLLLIHTLIAMPHVASLHYLVK